MDFPSLYGPDSDHSQELERLIDANRSKLLESWRDKQAVLEKSLEGIKAVKALAVSQSRSDVALMANVMGYVNVCSFDLAVLGELLVFERDPWKRRTISCAL